MHGDIHTHLYQGSGNVTEGGGENGVKCYEMLLLQLGPSSHELIAMWSSTRDNASQHSSIEGRHPEAPPSAEKLLAVDGFWEVESVFLGGVAAGRSPWFHWMAPHPCI